MEKLSVPIAIVIAGALIGGALYYSNIKIANDTDQILRNGGAVGTGTTGVNMRPVGPEDHILGNPDADLIIVEYSDTECPYCKVFHQTLTRVMNEYGNSGKVAWVYRHFPIDSLHKKARKEAEASECAAELGGQEKFWQYINKIYEITPSNDGLDASQLPKIAGDIGLDVVAFNSCLSSGRHAAKVEADYQDAVKSGGRGTPHSILVAKDGTKTIIQGAQPYENIKNVIDAFLD